MFKSDYIKKLEARVAELEDVLTRETCNEETNYLGSEIDGKVEQSEFEDFKKKIIGKPNYTFDVVHNNVAWSIKTDKTETVFEILNNINKKLDNLEKYLGIKYVKEERKVEGYRKVSKK